MKLIRVLIEIIGWVQIALAPTLVSVLIAFCIYLKWNTHDGMVTAMGIVAVGFIAGAAWATRIWIKYGTSAWLSGKTEKS